MIENANKVKIFSSWPQRRFSRAEGHYWGLIATDEKEGRHVASQHLHPRHIKWRWHFVLCWREKLEVWNSQITKILTWRGMGNDITISEAFNECCLNNSRNLKCKFVFSRCFSRSTSLMKHWSFWPSQNPSRSLVWAFIVESLGSSKTFCNIVREE